MTNPSEMSVEQWVQTMERRRAGAILPGLSRIKAIGETLSLLHPRSIVITVAGTNGKGSTVAALEALYLAAGYRVAAYTSPHLLTFNERIRFNGKNIEDADLCRAFAAVDAADEQTILSGFELATLAALWHFDRLGPDVMILEVGLGGRLDATNVIDSDVAVVTTIDFDHQEYLGHTLAAIGCEKVGIARPGRPLVLAEAHPDPKVLEACRTIGCTLVRQGEDFQFEERQGYLAVTLRGKPEVLLKDPAPLHPQALATAVVVSETLQEHLPVTALQRETGLREARIMGRVQRSLGPVSVVYDVSHNPQSVRLLAETLARYPVKGRVHAVFSALGDKNLDGLVTPMLLLVDHWYSGVLQGSRAATSGQLQAVFDAHTTHVDMFPNVSAAWSAACHRARTGDLIVVYGSFLTVGAVMSDGRMPADFKEVV